MKLEHFNQNYSYTSDGTLDSWTVITPKEGKYKGDCEDYCLTLKKLIPQFKNWDLYFCKINGNGHCILYKDESVIDCNVRSVVSFSNYCKIYKVSEFNKYSKFTIFSKLLFAKIFKIIGRINY